MGTPVTVLMPVYNAETYLKEAIDSILGQSFNDFEFVILDNKSTDRSVEIIKSYNDSRIKLYYNDENLGLIKSLNRGLELSGGKYIARMDADDISYPQRLKKQFDYLELNPDVGLCGTSYQNMGDLENICLLETENENIKFRLLYQFHFCHPSWMFNREIILKYGIRYRLLRGEDYDFIFQIMEHTKTANLPDILYKYRQYKESTSKKTFNITDENSNTIKKMFFNKLGLQVSLDDLLLFRNLAQQVYKPQRDYIKNSERLLSSMVIANKSSNYLNNDFFENKIFTIWYNLCLNLTTLGFWNWNKFYSSDLSSLSNLTINNRLKFLLKTIVKYKS